MTAASDPGSSGSRRPDLPVRQELVVTDPDAALAAVDPRAFDGPLAKAFSHGTHRSVDPSETWARLRDHLPAIGVTRVADVTGLDRLGLHVYLAIQPLSRSLSTAQGKGTDAVTAKVSAVMEAAETWSAERHELPVWWATSATAASTGRAVDLEAVDGYDSSRDHGQELPWTPALDLLGGGPVWLPYEAVQLDMRLPLPDHDRVVGCSGNGLASGNHPVEAALHALYEVLERHSLRRWERLPASEIESTLVDLGTLDGYARELLDRLERVEARVLLWNATDPAVGVPTAFATVVETNPHTDLHTMPFSTGTGTHLDPDVAACRAITEAVQTRATYVSGSREDLTRPTFAHVFDVARLRRVRSMVEQTGADTLRRADWPQVDPTDLGADLATTLAATRRAGLTSVLAVDVPAPVDGVAVARVVVPGAAGVH